MISNFKNGVVSSSRETKERILEKTFEKKLTFLVETDNSFRDGLSDSIRLRNRSSSLDTNTNIYVGEFLLSQKKDRLVCLLSERLRL